MSTPDFMRRRLPGEVEAYIDGWAAGAKGVLDYAARRGGLTDAELEAACEHATGVVEMLRAMREQQEGTATEPATGPGDNDENPRRHRESRA